MIFGSKCGASHVLLNDDTLCGYFAYKYTLIVSYTKSKVTFEEIVMRLV